MICYIPGPDATVTKTNFKKFLRNIEAKWNDYPKKDCDFVIYGHNIVKESLELVIAAIGRQKNAISL